MPCSFLRGLGSRWAVVHLLRLAIGHHIQVPFSFIGKTAAMVLNEQLPGYAPLVQVGLANCRLGLLLGLV